MRDTAWVWGALFVFMLVAVGLPVLLQWLTVR